MTPPELHEIRTQRLVMDRVTLGALLGVDPASVWRWETGAREISEPVARLVRVLVEVPGVREWLETRAFLDAAQ